MWTCHTYTHPGHKCEGGGQSVHTYSQLHLSFFHIKRAHRSLSCVGRKSQDVSVRRYTRTHTQTYTLSTIQCVQYVCHSLFKVYKMTHSTHWIYHVWHDSFNTFNTMHDSFNACDMTHSYSGDSEKFMPHSMHVTWLNIFIVTWLNRFCTMHDMTHLRRMTWLIHT